MKDPKAVWVEKNYPIWFRIVRDNPYRLPIGKTMRGRYRLGDILLPIELWGRDRTYCMLSEEVREVGCC